MAASRFEALLQISDRIAGARDLQELLRLLAPTLREAVDFDYVAIFLHDPEKNLMIVLLSAADHLRPAARRAFFWKHRAAQISRIGNAFSSARCKSGCGCDR